MSPTIDCVPLPGIIISLNPESLSQVRGTRLSSVPAMIITHTIDLREKMIK